MQPTPLLETLVVVRFGVRYFASLTLAYSDCASGMFRDGYPLFIVLVSKVPPNDGSIGTRRQARSLFLGASSQKQPQN